MRLSTWKFYKKMIKIIDFFSYRNFLILIELLIQNKEQVERVIFLHNILVTPFQ
jgi:hypothetical protein